jgi:membrane associated rhomboid family serine protease
MGPTMPNPDLFVVCKQCGSEVSPYITECPYCGARLRRRAPKLPRMNSRGRKLSHGLTSLGVRGRSSSGEGRPRTSTRTSSASASSASSSASAGIFRRRQRRSYARSEAPYATIALVAAGCAGWVLVRGGYLGSIHIAGLGYVSGQYASFFNIAIGGPLHGEWWKLFTSPFAYVNGWYAFVALLACALFGWLLERRHGPLLVLVVFFGGAITGALLADAVYAEPIVSGANGGALALIGAWSVPDLQAVRRGDYYEGDLLGAGAIAATLLLLPYARPEASWLAGVVGGLVGLVLGAGTYLLHGASDE